MSVNHGFGETRFSRPLRVISQGTVDNKLGPDRLAGPKTLDQTSNLMIARPLSGSLNCAVHGIELHLFGTKAFPPTHTINVAHLTYQQLEQLLTSLAMMRFGPSIEPITFPTLSRYATCYATDAG